MDLLMIKKILKDYRLQCKKFLWLKNRLIKLCNLLGRRLNKDELFYFMKKCKCEISERFEDNESLIIDDESEKINRSEIRASFYRIMEA